MGTISNTFPDLNHRVYYKFLSFFVNKLGRLGVNSGWENKQNTFNEVTEAF